MKIVFSFLFTIFLPIYLNAQSADEKLLFDKMAVISNNFYEILNDDKNNAQMRRDKIIKEVIHLFDFKLMARLSLDKNIRHSISKEQYKEFTDVFEDYIKDFYLDRIDLLKGTSSNVKESTKNNKNRIFVKATVDSDTGSTLIVYKFYKNKENKWFIYDLEIANVSILQSYRAQFSSYLSEHSFDELLIKLKKQA
ncbi:MAG: ABC transporter substrate-binding protein [Thiovulaceae bacterium]|nr:ABC transporter substrate-binding protein [Sulfurimonadaceae bacterium]MCW9027035.1 ABC transporter substrate-binding protein [Sulfurimonadaceae bacterium]